MATKVLVENLACEITEEALKEVFAQVGCVESVSLETGLITRRPNGSGYVEMSLDVDAYRAVNCFNGATLKDRKIQVTEAVSAYERAIQMLQHQLGVIARYGTDLKKELARFH